MEDLVKEFGELFMVILDDKILQHSLEQDFGDDIEYNGDYFVLKYSKKNIEENEMGIPLICFNGELIINNKKFKYNKFCCVDDYNQLKIMNMLKKNNI